MKVAKFKFYDVLKDKVSGFSGVVLGITFYATNCIHYGLASQKLKTDGTVKDWEWFDESRVILVKSAKEEKIDPSSGLDMNLKCK